MEVEKDPKKRGKGKTVLVVDDSPMIRKELAAAFLSDGFKTCVEAENGKDGIDAAERINPDLIVLDLSMPVMNGLQAAPQLRKMLPKTPIILFTFYAPGLSQMAVSNAGIDLVLEKTVPLSTLIEKAHELMRIAAN
jgi:CheY-like chemotaxis protein